MPATKSLEDIGHEIVDQILAEDGPEEENREVHLAHSILSSAASLQTTLPSPTPAQLRELTAIRAAVNTLIRLHNVSVPHEGRP